MMITVEILQQADACSKQVVVFERIFGPAGAAWTPDNLAKALRAGLDIEWASRALSLPLDLSGVNLSGVNLSWAHLPSVDLSGADLSNAVLYGTGLSDANLSGANLSGADLSWAYLPHANLTGAILDGAKLDGTILPMGCRHDKMPGQEVSHAD